MSYPSVILAEPDLGYYYRLGESSGTTAKEEKEGADGTYKSVTGLTLGQTGALAGDSNTAVLFAGDAAAEANRGFVIRETLPSTLSLTNVAFEAWVKMSASPGAHHHPIIEITTSSSTKRLNMIARRNSTGFRLSVWDETNAWRESDTTLASESWVYVVGSVTGKNVTFFINGVEHNTVSVAANVPTGQTRLLIGGRSGTEFIAGTLDEVALYKNALSLAQVEAHYAAGSTSAARARRSMVA